MNDIVINEEELTKIISKLDVEIKKMETIFQELDNELKSIEGSNDIWVSDTQRMHTIHT